MTVLVDSHCHFDFPEFDSNRDPLWQQCIAAGVRALVIPGIEPAQWPRLLELREAQPNWYFSIGIHPWWIEEVEIQQTLNAESVAAMMQPFLKKNGCVAVGECGLDKIKNLEWSKQQNVLEMHLQLAKEFQLPVILHCVKAHSEMIALLKKYRPERGGVVHAFSGSVEVAREYLRLGFYLGIGGTITYERAQKTRNAVTQLPLESMLLETDAPSMPLAGQQGAPNSPLSILKIAECLAQLRGESLEQIAAATTENAQRLFGLVVR